MDVDYEMNPALGRDGGLTGMDLDEELAEMNANESSGSKSGDEIQGSSSDDGIQESNPDDGIQESNPDDEIQESNTDDEIQESNPDDETPGLGSPQPASDSLLPAALPTELLSTIFIFLVDSELATESHMPVRLSHVCSTWRATALGDAALWARVNVQECDGQRACAKRKVAELYMQRARMHPLEVAFSAIIGKPRRRPNACPCTLDLVLANMPRTRSLSLRWTRAYALPLLSRVAPADMARLDRLSVSLDHFASPYRSNIDLVAQLVASAPALRELYWRERVLPAGIPYARLTALALRRCPLNEEDVLRILRDAPALTLLEVSLFAAHSSSHPPLTHPALQSFGLAGEGARDGLFAALSFPALRHLWVGISELPSRALWPVRDAEVWLAFLGRMTRGLEFLELSEVRMEEKTLLRSLMLPQLAGLRDLSVHGDTLIAGYDLFEFLRPDPAGSVAPALPNLRKLRLSLCDVGDGVVGQILQSRFEHGMPMSRVVIRFFGTCEEHSKDSAVFRQLSASRATKVLCDAQRLNHVGLV
ncbi:hypothetical protein GGF50DRAFT_89148 [Schizophyllum commune]